MAIEMQGKDLVEGATVGKDLVEAWQNGHLLWIKNGISDIKQLNPSKLFLWLKAPLSQKSYRYDYMAGAIDSTIASATTSFTTAVDPAANGISSGFSSGNTVLPAVAANVDGIRSMYMNPEAGGWTRQMALRNSTWSISFAFLTNKVYNWHLVGDGVVCTEWGDKQYGQLAGGMILYGGGSLATAYISFQIGNLSILDNSLKVLLVDGEDNSGRVLNDKGHGWNVVTIVKKGSEFIYFFNGARGGGVVPGTNTTVLDSVSTSFVPYKICFNELEYKNIYADLAFFNRALTDNECYEIFNLYNSKNLPYIKPEQGGIRAIVNNALLKIIIRNESGEDLPLNLFSSMKIFQTGIGDYTVTNDENGEYWGYAVLNNYIGCPHNSAYLFMWHIENNSYFSKYSYTVQFNDDPASSLNNISTGTWIIGPSPKTSSVKVGINTAVMTIRAVEKPVITLPKSIMIAFPLSYIIQGYSGFLASVRLTMILHTNNGGEPIFHETLLTSLVNSSYEIDLADIEYITEIEFIMTHNGSAGIQYFLSLAENPNLENTDKTLLKGYYINSTTTAGDTAIIEGYDWNGYAGKAMPLVFSTGPSDSAVGARIANSEITNDFLVDLLKS